MTEPAPHRRHGGLFLTFEGGDGSGKSTQMRLLADRLEALGKQVVLTAEPGGTRIGREIRHILLNPANTEMSTRAELLLYFASRAQNVEECILPALAEGKVVLSDRYTDSSLAYQGAGRGLGLDTVWRVHEIACQGLLPDLTFVFEIDLETGLERARNNKADRLDLEAVGFHERVFHAYRELAAREPGRIRLIDARRSVEDIAAEVWNSVQDVAAFDSVSPER